MAIHVEKFVQTKTGKLLMSILLGLGLASLFRMSCKGKKCFNFKGPSDINDKIYKSTDGKCYKYNEIGVKCDKSKRIVRF